VFFAFDKTIAFWGEGARGEGAFSFVFLGVFFTLLCLFFKEKQWHWFFRLSLFVGFILFFVELFQFFGGMQRPESLLGNPNFLATYFIFSITAALLLIKKFKAEPFWNYVSYGSITSSLIGILITESRGALAGVVVGGVTLLVFFLLHKQTEKKIKKVAGVLLGSFIILSSLFFATKQNTFWQHIPGISRLADFSFSDATTQARIINTKEALQSVSPKNEGVTRFLFGWGWDNYTFAWQKYYKPALYQFDRGIFDRTHNKFFDLLAMGGIVTLLLYLCSLVFFVRNIVSLRKDHLWVSAVLFFWCTSYVVQNLFTFDTVTSYIAFYVLLAYVVSLVSLQKYENK
jgi:O-antigen ligase